MNLNSKFDMAPHSTQYYFQYPARITGKERDGWKRVRVGKKSGEGPINKYKNLT